MARAGMSEYLFLWSRRILTFSLLFSCALLLLYAVGNYQGFLDASQSMLLDLASASLWASCLAGVCVLVLLVVTGIRRGRFAWVRFIGTFVALVASGALVALLQFLAAWTRG